MNESERQDIKQQQRADREHVIRARRIAYAGADIPQIGHLCVNSHLVEGTHYRQCLCGFLLALTPSNRVYWLRAAGSTIEITSFDELLRAVSSSCWKYPRRAKAPQPDAAPKPAPTQTAPPPRPVAVVKPSPAPLQRTYTPATPRGRRAG